MKKSTFLLAIAAAAVWLTGSPAAKADLAFPNVVNPADTFNFYILGSNSTSGVGYTLGSVQTAVFGLTTTFTGAGVDGQNYTISSSETTVGSTTTDTFTVSTPASFINGTTLNGTTITALSLYLGFGNTVDFTLPLSGVTTTGSTLYSTSSTLALTPSTTFSNSLRSISAVEGINSGTSAINSFNVRSFTYTISYAAVPEPSTWAMMGLGLVVGAVVVRRRTVA